MKYDPGLKIGDQLTFQELRTIFQCGNTGGMLQTNKFKTLVLRELDVEIYVGEPFQTVEYDYPDFHLSMDCFLCGVKSGKVVLKEHKAARWLTVDELDSVDWLPADRGLIEELGKIEI